VCAVANVLRLFLYPQVVLKRYVASPALPHPSTDPFSPAIRCKHFELGGDKKTKGQALVF
jgi:hypothetical protein